MTVPVLAVVTEEAEKVEAALREEAVVKWEGLLRGSGVGYSFF